MAGAEVIDVRVVDSKAAYAGPFASARGGVISQFVQPDGSKLWMLVADLDAGAEVEWNARHGDEALFVAHGQLRYGDEECGPKGVLLVESDVPAVIRVTEPTRIVQFGSVSPEAPDDGHFGAADPDGHGVHVLGEFGRYYSDRGTEIANEIYYADSTCPTCRATLLRNSAPPDTRVASHVHSEDEIIYMLTGDIQFGATEVVPGMALAIAGNYRYGFRTNAGCEFLNFRRDVSWFTRDPKSTPILETLEVALAGGGGPPVVTE